MFYFVLFSMPVSRPQRLFHVCDVFHGFDFVSLFYSTRLAFFRNFFFSARLSLLFAAFAFFRAVTGVGHYLRSRGVA